MKLEVGKYYRSKGGAIYGPLEKNSSSTVYPFISSDHTWDENGRFDLSRKPDYMDLISEVFVSDTPVDLPTPGAFNEAFERGREAMRAELKAVRMLRVQATCNGSDPVELSVSPVDVQNNPVDEQFWKLQGARELAADLIALDTSGKPFLIYDSIAQLDAPHREAVISAIIQRERQRNEEKFDQHITRFTNLTTRRMTKAKTKVKPISDDDDEEE